MDDVARTAGRVPANGIELAYETFGEAGVPPVVLIMGLATQMIAWPDELCEGLARRGLFVVRFDNRDVGESTHLSSLPPRLADILVRRRLSGMGHDLPRARWPEFVREIAALAAPADGYGVTWLALFLMAVALPALVARLAGGYPPNPGPELAALAPLAAVPAVTAMIIAAFAAWWLAALLAIPAALLVTWQLPPLRRARFRAAPSPSLRTGSAAATLRLRLLTVNAKYGAADPAALLHILRQHDVDVLAVQELTPAMVSRLTEAGLTHVLPFSHLDPRPRWRGTGLWALWPLIPLPPVPGQSSAAPRARIDPPGGFPVTVTAVHPIAPSRRHAGDWRRELAMIRETLASADKPQVVAGDFNATRDHRAFRELLAAGFLDCADASQNRSWPGFTWPASGRAVPVLRLDHVLVSRTATVPMTRVIRVPRTDHRGVLADIEFTRTT